VKENTPNLDTKVTTGRQRTRQATKNNRLSELEERTFYLNKYQRPVTNYVPKFTAGFSASGTSRNSPSCPAG